MFGEAWHRLSKDGISANIKDNKKVIVATDGWYDELTCLISTYFSSDFLAINVSVSIIKTWFFFVCCIKWRRRSSRCECYCIFVGYIIILFFVLGDGINGIGCWYGSVHIFFNKRTLGWADIEFLCIHMFFECGFRIWGIFGHLNYS